MLANKTILITGAAGSIGFEIVTQVCRFNPRSVILFEIDETELHRVELALRRDFPDLAHQLRFVVGDVRDEDRVRTVFDAFKPDLVFHAAAYKHVPIMEFNVHEAVKVNICGSYLVAHHAARVGAERFVMISTDKAVRPTSVMGATKRIAEHIVGALNTTVKTEYISVRFGNVLGSRGSVLPLFLDQIQRGGPITVTHRDMQRYFMTIPEAISLVLQASAIGRGGDVMVLDMGKPVKILDLAEELIRLQGLEPYKDIDIQFVGVRPGEKLFEEILTAEEGTLATRHEQIFIASAKDDYSLPQIESMLVELRILLSRSGMEGKEIRNFLKEHVRWYRESSSSFAAVPTTLVFPSPSSQEVYRPPKPGDIA